MAMNAFSNTSSALDDKKRHENKHSEGTLKRKISIKYEDSRI